MKLCLNMQMKYSYKPGNKLHNYAFFNLTSNIHLSQPECSYSWVVKSHLYPNNYFHQVQSIAKKRFYNISETLKACKLVLNIWEEN